MNNKFIKLIIVVLIVIILCIVSLLYLLKKQDNNFNDINDSDVISENSDLNEETNEELAIINSCVQLYVDAINKTNSNYYIINENNEYINNITSEEVKESIYNLLSENYIKSNNISIDNVWENVNATDEKVIFVLLDLKCLVNGDISKYVVYGECINMNCEKVNENYFIINIDNKNERFAIEPINKLINNIDEIRQVDSNLSIDLNNDNYIISPNLNDNYLSTYYFNNFKYLMLSDISKCYEHFEDEYAQKRFGSLEEFEKYVTENRDEIIGLRSDKYLVNNENGYIQYVVQDQYENYYIFDIKSITDYKAKLDTYTILSEEMNVTYSDASNQKKVQINIDRFFKMINRHDYKTSYAYLATSFKNNYSISENVFEQIVNNKFFKYNDVEYIKFEEIANDTYLYEIKLKDITENVSDAKTINIIMKLNDNNNFELSFDL